MELHARRQGCSRDVVGMLENFTVALKVTELVKALDQSGDGIACCGQGVLLADADARTATVAYGQYTVAGNVHGTRSHQHCQ